MLDIILPCAVCFVCFFPVISWFALLSTLYWMSVAVLVDVVFFFMVRGPFLYQMMAHESLPLKDIFLSFILCDFSELFKIRKLISFDPFVRLVCMLENYGVDRCGSPKEN